MIPFYSCKLTFPHGRTFESDCYSCKDAAYREALTKASEFFRKDLPTTQSYAQECKFTEH